MGGRANEVWRTSQRASTTAGVAQQKLAEKLGVTIGYISKVETERLQFGDYPSEKFIHKLADALQHDEDELLLLTDRVPEADSGATGCVQEARGNV